MPGVTEHPRNGVRRSHAIRQSLLLLKVDASETRAIHGSIARRGHVYGDRMKVSGA